MCVSRTSTVMTTIPKLRMTLRKGKFVKTTPKTTRDPTYASKQINNYARTSSMVHEKHTSNTYTAPQTLNQIPRGDISRLRAKNINQEHPILERIDKDGKQTPQENKGCRTNTAPPGTKRTTSSKNCNDQVPDPKAESIQLVVASSIDEDGEPKRCRRKKDAEQTGPR